MAKNIKSSAEKQRLTEAQQLIDEYEKRIASNPQYKYLGIEGSYRVYVLKSTGEFYRFLVDSSYREAVL